MGYAIRLNAKAKGYLEDGEGKRVALRLRRGEVHLGWGPQSGGEAFWGVLPDRGVANSSSFSYHPYHPQSLLPCAIL